MTPVARTPQPPYTAVIFTSVRAATADATQYAQAAVRMAELAAAQPGYLGMDSAHESVGITVSYWVDAAHARAWKQVAEHRTAQQRGAREWYENYRVRIATVEREYGSPRST